MNRPLGQMTLGEYEDKFGKTDICGAVNPADPNPINPTSFCKLGKGHLIWCTRIQGHFDCVLSWWDE